MKESIIYWVVKTLGGFIRLLPLSAALCLGRVLGRLAYYLDHKRKSQVYLNLKTAFTSFKTPQEIKGILKALFDNYGQNIIELFRLPLMNRNKFEEMIAIEGKEHIEESLKQGKGLILLAMHFGSWEMASLSCAMLDHPYKMLVKPQKRYSQLDELINSYRTCTGEVVLSRGMGTRDVVKSLKDNEIIGMVVDQGGRDGILVPFFGRKASMSVGALRMSLKWGTPICFSIIIREKGGRHRLIIQKPLELENSGKMDQDIIANLVKITRVMEDYICQFPAEYMWFYKIWKYCKQANLIILSDGKIGHLRQSQNIARNTRKALTENKVESRARTLNILFKSKIHYRTFSLLTWMMPMIFERRLSAFKYFFDNKSYHDLVSVKADYIISCGASVAGINRVLSKDHKAKSIVILKPGIYRCNQFDLVILPRHDLRKGQMKHASAIFTHAAPNLITEEYLNEQSQLLLERFPRINKKHRIKIGLFIGGDSKKLFLSPQLIRTLIYRLKELARDLSIDILITTSRRTPSEIEDLLSGEFSDYSNCPLLVIANKDNVPEAIGGILGLADIMIVSGDSISMISEAASSGKTTVVFPPDKRNEWKPWPNKHEACIENLKNQGFIVLSEAQNIDRKIKNLIDSNMKTKSLDDNDIILEAVKKVI